MPSCGRFRAWQGSWNCSCRRGRNTKHDTVKLKRQNGRLTKTVLLLLLLTGCATPMVKLNNSNRLMERPDFPVAARAAPEWCRDALKTINELEYEIERR